MRGVKVIGVSFVVFIAAALGGGIYQNSIASQAGFESYTTYREALDAGITDPDVWAAEGAAILAEQEARRVQQAAEAEAERAREAEEAAAVEAERHAREQQEREDERRRGFHCLSAWDGSHRDFRHAVRDRMREPDSFEHIETRVAPVDEDGMHTIIMQYRARNGFGGMNVGTALGQYRNSDCSFTILSIE